MTLALAQSREPDSAAAVVADCGGTGLASSALDSCLERVRVLEETAPSPELESLDASLEARARTPRTDEGSASAGPANLNPPAAGGDAYVPYRGAAGSYQSPAATEDPSGMGGGEPPIQDPDTSLSTPDGHTGDPATPHPQ